MESVVNMTQYGLRGDSASAFFERWKIAATQCLSLRRAWICSGDLRAEKMRRRFSIDAKTPHVVFQQQKVAHATACYD